MISTFTFNIPVEQYVAGIGTTTASFTYDGPDTIDYITTGSGELKEVGIESDYVVEVPDIKKTLNCGIASHLPYCYYFMDTVNDDYEPTRTTKDVTMENGDIYKEVVDPDINDHFNVRYNPASKWFYFEQITMPQNNVHADKAQSRKEWISPYKSETYKSFTTAVKNDLQTYIDALDTFIAANGLQKGWKYTTKPVVGTMPKLPATVKQAIDELPNNHELHVNTLDLEEGI